MPFGRINRKSSSLFELEQLEPRVLLSATPVAIGSAASGGDAPQPRTWEALRADAFAEHSQVSSETRPEGIFSEALSGGLTPLAEPLAFSPLSPSAPEVEAPPSTLSAATNQTPAPASELATVALTAAGVVADPAASPGAASTDALVGAGNFESGTVTSADSGTVSLLAVVTVPAEATADAQTQSILSKANSSADAVDSTAGQLTETLNAPNGPPTLSPAELLLQASPRVFSPGHSPGLMTLSGPEIWSSGESYVWEVNDVDAHEGGSPGWDFIQVNGDLKIQSTPSSRFQLRVTSLTLANAAGDVHDFDATHTYSWRILSATGGISGFDPTTIDVTTAGFSNALASGTFLLDRSTDAKDLYLRFVPNQPSAQLEVAPATWVTEGPFQSTGNGNTLVSPDNPVIGAVRTIALHPFNPAIGFAGTVNGGVWVSSNLDTDVPTWTALTDRLPSLSVGALVISPFSASGSRVDASTPVNQLVLYLGTGSFSSAGGEGGPAAGMFKSVDGGTNWARIGNFAGQKITTLVASQSADGAVFVGTDSSTDTAGAIEGAGGVWRTLNGGTTWTRLSGKAGLPEYKVTQIVEDTTTPGRLYVAFAGSVDASTPLLGRRGVFRTDLGLQADATTLAWQALNADLTPDYNHNGTFAEAGETIDSAYRIRLAVSSAAGQPLYIAVIGPDAQLASIFRYTVAAGTSTRLAALPQTNPTGQGEIHFGIVADSTDHLFIAGAVNGISPYLGIAYRWDGGSAWVQITTDTGAGPGAYNTAPHGDFRELVLPISSTDLIAASDGGIYRLKNSGSGSPKWIFIGTGLSVTEIGQSLSYDQNTNSIFAGTQDTGVIRQTATETNWVSMLGGDGSYVGVEYSGLTTYRYFMGNNFGSFYRQTFTGPDTAGAFAQILLKSAAGAANYSGLSASTAASATPDNGASVTTGSDYVLIPFAVNAVEPGWLLLGRGGLYKSTDRGDTVSGINSLAETAEVSALVYGGHDGATAVRGVMYVARGSTIGVSSDDGVSFSTVTPAGAGRISDIAMDPSNWRTAVAVDGSHVWLLAVAADGTFSAKDVSGNLGTATADFKSVQVVSREGRLVIVVGAKDGAYTLGIDDLAGFSAANPPPASWVRLGTGLPNVAVTDLQFNSTDDVLVAGTLGRGAWSIASATQALFDSRVLRIDTGGTDDEITLRLAPANGATPKMLDVLLGGVSIGSFELRAIRGITVSTGAGDDTLIVDSTNGEIAVPDDIAFYAGDGNDTLRFTGATASGLETSSDGDVAIRQMGHQIVRALRVETFTDTTFYEDFLAALGHAWDAIVNFFRDIGNSLTTELPIIGDSLGSALNGLSFANLLPRGDPDGGLGPVAAGAKDSSKPSGSNSFLERIFESVTGFSFKDLGTSITDPLAFQTLLDGLDAAPGNVIVDAVTKHFALGNATDPFRRTLEFYAPINAELLGGVLQLHGTLKLAVDIDLRLDMGVDARGFYFSTSATAQPEITIRNLRVNGTVSATGNFGFLEVVLDNATLALDPNVGLQVDVIEAAGNDAYGHAPDGKLRFYDFATNPANLVSTHLLGNPTADDVVLTAGLKIAALDADGESLFDIPEISLQLAWPDITKPLQVTLRPAGGAAEILQSLLNFSANDMFAELRRLLNYLGQLGKTDLLNVRLPFGSGLTIGKAFDFSEAFLDKIYSYLVDTEITSSSGNGNPTGALAQGRLSTNGNFTVSIGGATAVSVTISQASTNDNSTLQDLVTDLNSGLAAAGLASQVKAILDGRQVALRLLAGSGLVISGDAASAAFTELGFSRDSGGIEILKFPSLQKLLAKLEELLDPDGAGPLSFDVMPALDIAGKTISFKVSFGYHNAWNTSFKYDPSIGLGDLVELSFGGEFGLTVDLAVGFTLGINLKASGTPHLYTALSLPPPSSGRISGASSFAINLNDGTRYNFSLPAGATAGNIQLSDLVDALNALLLGRTFQSTPLNQAIRFVQATSGNAIILEGINEDLNANGTLDSGEDTNANGVLDSWLDRVTSIAIEADNADPIVTQVGFTNQTSARSILQGLFLEDVSLSGSLTVSASNLTAKARLAIFEVSTTGGTASGAVALTLSFTNPSDPVHPHRLDLDTLLRNLSSIGSYLSLDTALTGSLDIQLKNITVSPNLPTLSGDSLIPAGSMFRVYIPNIKDVHYNGAPYDAASNNAGTFVTYPQLGSFGDFNCVSFLDVLSTLDSLSDQLEGLKTFSFLNQPLPLINMSIGDVLDFAGDVGRAFKQLASGDGATIEKLEKDLEDFFHVSADQLSLSVDNTPISKTSAGTAGSPAVAKLNPPGAKNSLTFTAKANGAAQNDWLIDLVDDATFSGTTNDAAIVVDAANKVLRIKYNATYTTAETIRARVNAAASCPFTATLDTSGSGDGAANDGSGTVTETAIKFHLEYSLTYGSLLPFAFNLGDLVAMLPAGPVKDVLAGVTNLVQVEGSGTLNVAASAALNLDFGLDVSRDCIFVPFLYDTTGLVLSAAIRGTNLNFKAGVGALNVAVKNGTVTIDGDGNAATTTDKAQFTVGFKDNNGDGRHYFRGDETFFDASSIGVSLTAAASANLPLFALSSIPIGSTTDGPDAGTEPDNWLVFQSGPLQNLLSGDVSAVVLRAPDLASLFNDLNLCDLIKNSPVLLDGLDALLGTLQDSLGSTFSRNLPLVGDQLGKAANFIGEFRSGLLAQIRAELASAGDPIELVKKAVFDSIGAGGLDLLVKPDGSPLTAAEDVEIVCDASGVHFNLRMKQSVALIDTTSDPIAFNLGVPGFGLSVDGNVKIEVGYDFKLKFGINASEGFYFDTSDGEELRVEFKVTIPGLHAKGQLFFLQLDVADDSDGKDANGNERLPSSFAGYFSVNLKDPFGSNNHLTFSDLTNSGLTVAKLVDAQIGAKAELNLDIAVSFGGDSHFPRLLTEFDLDWNWTPGGSLDGDFSFGFHNLQLDIGSFISDFIKPILDKLHDITVPLGPVVTVLTTPIPIISDIAGKPFTLLDLAELWGLISPSTRDFVEVVEVIVELVNDTSTSNDGSILLPLGGFNLDVDKYGRVSRDAGDPAASDPAKLSNVQDGGAFSFLKKLEDIGITFPFLDISEVFKLFLGEPVSLVEYHLPILDFEASFELSIPIIGPLCVKFGGSIGAYADLTIGYDTYGIAKFLSSKEKDIADIFDGFYIKDVNEDGVDVPELVLKGSLYAAGAIDIGIAEAGVRGGLEVEVDFNLNDPDGDGRVRVSEIIANARQDIRCIFDIHGKFTAFLEAYLKINLFFFKIDETFRFAELTILEFDITCPQPILANYVDAGGSELETADGAGSLRLNIGDYAAQREECDVTDGNEKFSVIHIDGDPASAEGETVEVSYNGIKQTYYGVKKIWALCGAGNDTLDLRSVLAPIDAAAGRGIHGGPGDDTLYAGRGIGAYYGDDGNDVITAEVSDGTFTGVADEFHGGSGDDTLTGLDGNDSLFGDEGMDVLYGDAGDDHLEGGDGNDLIYGDLDNDVIIGGAGADILDGYDGNDSIKGEAGDDTITGGRGNDYLIGGEDNDTIDGGAGNDVILGDLGNILGDLQVSGIDGVGSDLLAGGPGADVIYGGGGDDSIFGGTLLVSGVATAGGDTDEEDFIDAGMGNDVVYGDDAFSASATTFPGANIGNLVWFDALDLHGVRNSIQDAGEAGVAGIKVDLYDSTNTFIGSTSTDTAGAYRFQGLRAGDYYLKFTVPTGLAFVTQDSGADDAVDSDVNPATGKTAIFTLAAGETIETVDAGVKGTTPVLVIDNPSIEEGAPGKDTNLTFTVTLSSVSDNIVTVGYRTSPGTALNILDYASQSWTLVFQPGETVKSIAIPIHGDNIDETDEQFAVSLFDPYNATMDLAHFIGTGTIIDDDAAPVVDVSDGKQVTALLPIPESTGVTFTIQLSHPSSRTIQVDYRTQQIVDDSGVLLYDSARAGVDYTNLWELNPGTVTFNPGETSKKVTIAIVGDFLDEYDEKFQLLTRLNDGTASDLAVIGISSATGTIADDDATPFIEWTIADPIFAPDVARKVNEGQAGNTNVTFTLHLTAVSGRDVSVDWSTAHGSAVNAAPDGELPDFVSALGTLKFRQGETVKQVTVEIIGDTRTEADEDFFVNILRAVNAQVNVTDDQLNHARVVIHDDESGDSGPWYVGFSKKNYTVDEGSTATITLVRAENSSDPVAVYWTLGGTATPFLDYTGVWENGSTGARGIVSFAAGETTKTFSIPTVGGDGYEGDETVVLHLLNPTGGPVRAPNDTAILTIQEKDPKPTAIIYAYNLLGPDLPQGAFENDGSGKLFFDVSVTGKSLVPVTIDWNSANGTALAGPDYVANGAPLFFGPVNGTETKQVFVLLVNDATPEVWETVLGRISNPQNVDISVAEDTATIADDDLAAAQGRVFADLNGNGFFDQATEYGLGGVSVQVVDGSSTQTTTTGFDGTYSVNVALGGVTVTVDETTTPVDSECTTGNSPQSATLTTSVLKLADIGFVVKPTEGKPDSSIGNGLAFYNDTMYGGLGNDYLDGGSGDDWIIGGHWLGPGGAGLGTPYGATLKQQAEADGNRKYVDPASIPAPGTLKGRVWRDVDLNNQEGAEFGVQNIQVNLYDSLWTLIATTYSDANGFYTFTKLSACDYYVQVLPPSGNKFAVKGVGPAATNSDVDAVTGLSSAITVGVGATVNDIDAGLQSVPGGSPGPWSVQFSHLVYSVRETDGFATVTVTRTVGSFQPVGVYYTADGTAVNPSDYLLAKGTMSFGVDETKKSFGVQVFDDGVTESPEIVQLFLRNPTGGNVKGNLPAAIILIFDNPNPDNDTIYGQDGNDVMLGDFGYFDTSGNPVLLGGMGEDQMFGSSGKDKIYGEGGNDLIEGGADDDTLDGGSENDTYRFDGDASLGNDTITEAATPFGGNDTIDLSLTSSRAITMDLSSAALQQVTTTLTLQLPSGNVIENAYGGDQNDILTGNSLDNILIGGAGSDVLTGAGGDDKLTGGLGSDTYLYDADAPLGHDDIYEYATSGSAVDTDTIDFGGTSAMSIALDLGSNVSQTVNPNLSITLSDGEGIEDIYGGAKGDTLTGNHRDNVIWGREGDDNLDGGPVGDTSIDTLREERGGGFELFDGTPVRLVFNGTETDFLSDFENISLVGDDNANTLNAASFSGIVRLDGRGGNDTIVGGSGSNFLTGGAGSDIIDGTLGIDVLTEQADADMVLTNGSLASGADVDTFIGTIELVALTGGAGDNLIDASAFAGRVALDGGDGNDHLIGTAQSDILIGGAGNDSLDGRAGDDVYLFDADSALGSDLITELPGGGTDRIDFTPTASEVSASLGVTTVQIVNSNLSLQLSAANSIENLRGGSGDDDLVGNGLGNVIEGGNGNDTLTGAAGNDVLDGGANSLFPTPQFWFDRVVEERNALNITLTNISLTFTGGETDTLVGIEAATLIGGAGVNTLDASAFSGSATLQGLGGNDVLIGGSGPDFLEGGEGNDALTGNANADTYVFDADTDIGSDTINDSGGNDTIDYSATSQSIITLSLAAAGVQVAARNSPSLVVVHRLTVTVAGSVENLIGGALNDTLLGSSSANRILGLGGNDSITGLGGDDFLVGGEGNDTYHFDADSALGTDRIWEDVGTGGVDTLDFSATTTQAISVRLGRGILQVINPNLSLRFFTAHSIENVIGGSLSDFLEGSTLDNRIEGRGGNDSLIGDWGNDTFVFDADSALGTDTISEQADSDGGIDTLDFTGTIAYIGVDLGSSLVQVVNLNLSLHLTSGAAIENLVAGSGGSTLSGNTLDNHLVGGAGVDAINGGGGDDILEGKSGNDVLTGGQGDDTYVFAANSALGTDTVVEAANGGFDVLDFSSTLTQAVNVDLSRVGAQIVNPFLILALPAADRLENVIGGAGDDVLQGNGLPNRLAGGGGNDRYLFDADLPLDGDIIEEADGAVGGIDTVDFSATTTTLIKFSLATTDVQTITTNFSLMLVSGTSLENVVGGARSDVLTGNGLDNEMTGGPGSDTLKGGGGTDTVVEQRDSDFLLKNTLLLIGTESDNLGSIEQARLTGGAGPNLIDASLYTLGPVTLDGGAGSDKLIGSPSLGDRLYVSRDANITLTDTLLVIGVETDNLSGIESATLIGGVGANIINATSFTLGPVIIDGGAGNDNLRGGSGNDRITGGLGSDIIAGGVGIDTVVERADADFTLSNLQLVIGADSDTLVSIEKAELTGGVSDNFIDASAFTAGAVVLRGLGGSDFLRGGARDDLMDGGSGDDFLEGGPGDDTYRFESDWGRDNITEGVTQGRDTVDFSAVRDGVVVNIGSGLSVSQGASEVVASFGRVEVVIGTTSNDAYFVTPSAATRYELKAGGGDGDVLTFDAGGLATTQVGNLITSSGMLPVTADDFDVVSILNNPSSPALASLNSVASLSGRPMFSRGWRGAVPSKAHEINRGMPPSDVRSLPALMIGGMK